MVGLSHSVLVAKTSFMNCDLISALFILVSHHADDVGCIFLGSKLEPSKLCVVKIFN